MKKNEKTTNNPTETETSILEVNKNDYYNEDNFISSNKTITEGKVVIYDGPEYLSQYEGMSVKVNGEDLFVYRTRVNHERRFSWTVPNTYAPVVVFDFEGKVHLEVTVEEEVTSAVIRPLVYGIAPTIKDKTISFDLEYTGNYVLEYNDNSDNVLHIFGNPIEENPITEASDDVIYVGPGVYKADAIPVKDNVTIYLAGGAYVYGQVRAEGLKNVTIRGRGIISGEVYQRRSESEYTIPIEMRYCDGVTIEGITILDPAGWTIALYKSENVTLDNVKIITARQNGDGISVQSCNNVTINGGFVRSWDDSLVIKNVDEASSSHIKFDGVVVWTDLAQSMEIGYETIGEIMKDITFSNITILHNYHKACISIHNGNNANIENVHYKNIIIEDASMGKGDGRNVLIEITTEFSSTWSTNHKTTSLGSINGVLIEDVYCYNANNPLISLRGSIDGRSGYSKDIHYVSNITFKNVYINDELLSNNYDNFESIYCENIIFQE